ncbi:MAG: CoA-binding protein [Pirellulaceae bacterium]
MNESIRTFFNAKSFAVAGASTNRSKFGNQVFRRLRDSGRTTYPLNPNAESVEGSQAFASLAALPEIPESLSLVTPPEVTRVIVLEAIDLGVKNLWMQPGAEDPIASQRAREASLVVIDDGSCLLIELPGMKY